MPHHTYVHTHMHMCRHIDHHIYVHTDWAAFYIPRAQRWAISRTFFHRRARPIDRILYTIQNNLPYIWFVYSNTRLCTCMLYPLGMQRARGRMVAMYIYMCTHMCVCVCVLFAHVYIIHVIYVHSFCASITLSKVSESIQSIFTATSHIVIIPNAHPRNSCYAVYRSSRHFCSSSTYMHQGLDDKIQRESR